MENAIFFIIIGDDERILDENVRYLNHLLLPEKMNAEYCIVSKNEDAFRIGQSESDAMYKVYLDQDAYIIDKNFILKILKVFEENQNIKLVGTRGYKIDLASGKLEIVGNNLAMRYGQNEKIGQICEGTDYGIIEVQAVDSHLFVTSQDMEWGNKSLKNQVVERSVLMRNLGYKTVVIREDTPPILFDNNIIDE